jgi:nicotinic acid mononucleotide adenylyltransferase
VYKKLVALVPMRAHPFHYGHALYLHQLSACFERVSIMLNREYSVEHDPFPFTMRREWMLQYVNQAHLTNVFVPMRYEGLSTDEEYPMYAEGNQFVVLTTNVTHKRNADLGFAVFNHESDRLPVPDDLPTHLYEFLNQSSMGTMIRERLRAGFSCDEYLPAHVREEAVLHLGSIR